MATHDDDQIPGQMNIDECIEVAEQGLDGKPAGDDTTSPATQHRSAPTQRPRRPLTVAEVVAKQLEDNTHGCTRIDRQREA